MDQQTVLAVTVGVSALGFFAGLIGHAVKPSPLQKFLLFVAALSPANVIGAVKAVQGKSTTGGAS